MTDDPSRVVAFVPDLMDRSRFPSGACRFAKTIDELRALAGAESVGTELLIVDLGRDGVLDAIAETDLRVVGFASHVDDELIATASALGCRVMARSRFFRELGSLLSSLE